MARGPDLYFAEAVLDLRERRSGVTPEAARPCEPGQPLAPGGAAAVSAHFERCDYETLWSSTSMTAGA